MNLRKHERETLQAVKEVVEPAGLRVDLSSRSGCNAHKKITITGPGGFLRSHTVSCSPRTITGAVGDKVRWAKKIVREFEQ